MNKTLLILVAPLAASLVTALAGVPAGAPADPFPLRAGWAGSPEFADGRAEVNTYDARLMREGAPRETCAYTILVAEDLDPGILVKADDHGRPGLVRAFKYALHTSTRTGMTEYRESTNAFLRASDWRTVKLIHSHQDWCGLTVKRLREDAGGGTLRWLSYWERDGGEGETALPLTARTVPADVLPVWVRALELSAGLELELEVLSSLQGSKVGTPMVVPGVLTVEGPVTREVRAGAFPVWEVQVEFGERRVEVSVETGFPHRVIRWIDAAGQSFELVDSQRVAYWEKFRDGDEALLMPCSS